VSRQLGTPPAAVGGAALAALIARVTSRSS